MEASGGAFSSRLFWSEKSEVFEEVRARVREGGRVPNMDFGQMPVEGGEVEVVRFSLGLLGLGILGEGEGNERRFSAGVGGVGAEEAVLLTISVSSYAMGVAGDSHCYHCCSGYSRPAG